MASLGARTGPQLKGHRHGHTTGNVNESSFRPSASHRARSMRMATRKLHPELCCCLLASFWCPPRSFSLCSLKQANFLVPITHHCVSELLLRVSKMLISLITLRAFAVIKAVVRPRICLQQFSRSGTLGFLICFKI